MSIQIQQVHAYSELTIRETHKLWQFKYIEKYIQIQQIHAYSELTIRETHKLWQFKYIEKYMAIQIQQIHV